jgi:hypothetical protein
MRKIAASHENICLTITDKYEKIVGDFRTTSKADNPHLIRLRRIAALPNVSSSSVLHEWANLPLTVLFRLNDFR